MNVTNFYLEICTNIGNLIRSNNKFSSLAIIHGLCRLIINIIMSE